MFAPVTITDDGVALYTEAQIDAITSVRKVRPARGAFGDWNQYDANGNVSVQIIGSTVLVTEEDEVKDDRGYATQTEQRMAERGDDLRYDPSANVWFARKGDKVERVYVGNSDPAERSYNPLHGYHKEADGIVSCYYCGGTFSAKWYIMQSNGGSLNRDAMERFTVDAMQHTLECRAEHAGTVLARMITWSGKPHLYRTRY